MIRKPSTKKLIVDLDGPDGNAYSIMALARSLGNKLKMDTEVILYEMREGDYENLIRVFNEYFPFVILETTNEELLI